MLGIIKRDLTIMLSDKKNRFILIFYIPFLLLIVESNEPKWLYFFIIVVYTYLFSIIPFSYDITGKAKYIINSLPISRKQVVLSKYLSTFVYFIITVVYAGIYLWIINATGIKNVDYFNMDMIIKAILTVMVSTSIVFPAYFRFEPKIAQIIHMIVFIIFFIVIVNINLLVDKSMVSHIGFLKEKYIIFAPIVIYIISLFLSMKLYQNRDL